jgi:hypothetical protein
MSLRLRPKPPACIPSLNRGTPWSAIDMADLDELVREGASIAFIAEYLRRDVGEVEVKIAKRRR